MHARMDSLDANCFGSLWELCSQTRPSGSHFGWRQRGSGVRAGNVHFLRLWEVLHRTFGAGLWGGGYEDCPGRVTLGSGCKRQAVSPTTLLVVGLDRTSGESTGALIDMQSTHRWLGHEVAQFAPPNQWSSYSQLNMERRRDILCQSPDVRVLTPSTQLTPVQSHQSCFCSGK